MTQRVTSGHRLHKQCHSSDQWPDTYFYLWF